MTFSVAHWGTFVSVCKGKMLLNILMASVISSHSRIHEEDVFEHTNDKCHLCTLVDDCVT